MKLLEFANGTYSSLQLDPECAAQLYAFCQENSLPDLVEADDYHCTIIYSHQPCPEVEQEDFNLPFEGRPKGYKLLGTEKPSSSAP